MRAIILAAGMGTRLKPMTLNKPKPLLEIRGISILENMLIHLKKSGVRDIVLVSGYKHELFKPLVEKYHITQLVFKDYTSCNSSQSLLFAKEFLIKGSIVTNGDLYITHDFCHLFKPNVSQFIAQQIPQNQSAWGYIVDENYKIIDIDTNAQEGYGDGIAFFDNERDIELFLDALQKCDRDDYWEEAVLQTLNTISYYAFFHTPFYAEIDSFADALSHALITPEEIAQQCADDGKAQRLAGITNTNYLITFHAAKQVIRIPGLHTEQIIDRSIESKILEIIKPLHITPESTFYGSGIKMSAYLCDFAPLDFTHIAESNPLSRTILEKITHKILTLHSISHTQYPQFHSISLCEEVAKYEKLAEIKLATPLEHKQILAAAKRLDRYEKVLCHRDLQLPNILYNSRDIYVIDFEYAGFSCAEWELGNMSAELELTRAQKEWILHIYNAKAKRSVSYYGLLCGELLSNYIWALWGWIYQRIDLGRNYLFRFCENARELIELESKQA